MAHVGLQASCWNSCKSFGLSAGGDSFSPDDIVNSARTRGSTLSPRATSYGPKKDGCRFTIYTCKSTCIHIHMYMYIHVCRMYVVDR